MNKSNFKDNIVIIESELKILIKTLYTLNWAHGDIKPGNILVNENFQLFVGDSDDMCNTTSYRSNYARTRNYSPSFFGRPVGERKEHDLWSFGIVMYEIKNNFITRDTEYKHIVDGLGKLKDLVNEDPGKRSEVFRYF